ncbi:FAD:protein FMN transferase [Dongia rigui]|uniref:FAD:protein FMN transferase n=1 Tax=Dongia rigui TaxID=940149 RepID=A0ABU5E0Y9_9PROT|nr:FAD:protein FMN transferase [Dongia rigui]MDY0873210.1 FAD:protein FMN transferase [Dongia rigui]
MSTPRTYSRRRVLSILAAATILPLGKAQARVPNMQPYRWQGLALGAEADLTLYAETESVAMEAIAASLAEIDRLERIFSLHRPDSAISQLNRVGTLPAPPVEFVELLSLALTLAERTDGRFDPSIQPLWQLYAKAGPAAAELDEGQLKATQALVDWRNVALSPSVVTFGRPGMQLTLNGIAQGYISDRIAILLQGRGFTHALVNLGELQALGSRADGSPWQIGLSAPHDRADLRETELLSSGAMATSAAAGLSFDRTGNYNHIVNARSLQCADPRFSVTVRSQSAAVADGLSTVGTLMLQERDAFTDLLRQFVARAIIIDEQQAPLVRLG